MSGKAAVARAWAEPSPPLRPDEHLPHALGATAIAVGRLIARAYQDRFRISAPEWRLMTLLAEAEAVAEADLLAGAAADASVARRTIGALLRRGLAASHGDRLALTEEGYRLYAEIAPLALAYEATLVAGLTPGEVTALKHLLRRLRSAADRLRGEAG